MAAQYELLKELLNSGTKLSFGQEFFYKFYQAFILKDRWVQYVQGVGTTLLVTAIALAMGVVLGSVVALIRVAHDQQRSGRRNPVLGFFNAVCKVYTLQTALKKPSTGFLRPERCWSWATRISATTLPSTTPIASAMAVTRSVVPTP
mgnify:CR=1 FL=1